MPSMHHGADQPTDLREAFFLGSIVLGASLALLPGFNLLELPGAGTWGTDIIVMTLALFFLWIYWSELKRKEIGYTYLVLLGGSFGALATYIVIGAIWLLGTMYAPPAN